MFLLCQKLALLFTALFITCDYTSTFSPTTWVLFWCCCIVHGSDIYPPLICVVSLSTMGPGSCLNRYKVLAVSLAVLAAFLLAVDIGLGVYCKWLLQAAVFVILRNFLNLKKKGSTGGKIIISCGKIEVNKKGFDLFSPDSFYLVLTPWFGFPPCSFTAYSPVFVSSIGR